MAKLPQHLPASDLINRRADISTWQKTGHFYLGLTNFQPVLTNVTESIKVGLYAKSYGAIHRGDLVALCLPVQDQQLGLDRHYLMPGSKCHGSVPLLKQVIAIPGDDVQLTMDYIAVNGQRSAYPTELKDHSGRNLTRYPRGAYPKTKGYWLIGNASPHSWDSRYWGPLPAKQILYKITPLITFGK